MAIPFLAMVLGILGNVTYFFGWNYKVMLAGKGKAAAEIRSGTMKRLMLLPLHLTDFAIFLLLMLLLPWPTAFVWAFFGFSVITFPIYGAYLENWGDWKNPWESGSENQSEMAREGSARD